MPKGSNPEEGTWKIVQKARRCHLAGLTNNNGNKTGNRTGISSMTGKNNLPLSASTHTGSTRWAFGFVLLSICTAMQVLLALEQREVVPHVGPEGGGLQTVLEKWSAGTLVDWPLSFFALAYFVVLLGAWSLFGLQGVSSLLPLVRVGALLSAVLSVLQVLGGSFCPSCLVSHAANLAFWLLLERSPSPARVVRWTPLVTVA